MRIPKETYKAFFEKAGIKKKKITDIEFYNEFLLELEKKKLYISPDETPFEFASRIQESGISLEDGQFMAQEYYRIKYGKKNLSDSFRVMKVMELARETYH
jgi:hypothetical protein